MSSTASQAIRGYQLLSQTFEFREDMIRAARLDQIKTARARPGKKGAAPQAETAEQRAEKIKDIDFHRVSWDEFRQKLGLTTNDLDKGLSAEEAAQRNTQYGDNSLSERKKTPWWLRLTREFTSFFSLLLWAGALMSFVVYGLERDDAANLYLGLVLVVVVVVSGLVTFFQNAKSESIMEGFRNFIPQQSTVVRDGRTQSVLSAKLVPGDVVEIREGQRIPADLRILSSSEMRVDNSSLTGETEPLLRSEVCDQPEKLLETRNVAFFGTLCKQGQGRGVVFNIGDNTIIGQIAMLADTAAAGKSPLRQELDRFIVLITCIAFSFGLIFFCCGFLLRYKFIENLIFAIGIIVANVPEGMLATITITLSVSAHRLSRHSVLVKNLESVETLGSTSCICSDKTGTLTQNKMTVEHLWYNLSTKRGHSLEKCGPDFAYEWSTSDPDFEALRLSAALNTAAVFDTSLPTKEVARLEALKEAHPDQYPAALERAQTEWVAKLKHLPFFEREVIGDASETAIVKFFQPIEDVQATRDSHRLAVQADGTPARVPFNSSYKFALTCYCIDAPNSPHSFAVYLKGAPEIVWKRCKYVMSCGHNCSIDSEVERKFEEANRAFAKNGERVLGFARMLLPREAFERGHPFAFKDPFALGLPEEFTFVGLMSLIDPPRDTVPMAIEKCKTSGIKVIMVTGDQQLTAASIARKIGIIEDRSSIDIMEEEGCSYEEAVERADAIVVNGEMLTLAALEDEGLPEAEKGRRLERWLKKPQIVFARTSPAQKLYIVRGCQKLGYVVAVTGDGVNDSPAIKQADIGIAMGITGSDVAKDAAQMILLNDDFASIIVGVEEGRKIFDNLKKAITYILTSNVPELLPFLSLIIFALPLPLSTIEVLLIDVGTDMFPAASFAYEKAELDIMTRPPRNSADHLVTGRLMTLAYLQLGVVQAAAAFISYFVVMLEFGFPPSSLFGLVRKPYLPHNPSDRFDPEHPFLGNTNAYCDHGVLRAHHMGNIGATIDFSYLDNAEKIVGRTLDWLYARDSRQDLRMGFLLNNCAHGHAKPRMRWAQCRLPQLSLATGIPVCFTTEALRYAQASYFFTVVVGQIINAMVCKTRILPLCFQGLNNQMMLLGWATEVLVLALLAYARTVSMVLGVRDLTFLHIGFYGAFLMIGTLTFDELRKLLIRNFPSPNGKPNFFVRNTLT